MSINEMSVYKKIIDHLASETRLNSVYHKRATENDPFPVASEQKAFNELLLSLTEDQRKQFSEILLQERNSTIHDVLAVLTWWVERRDLTFNVNGRTM